MHSYMYIIDIAIPILKATAEKNNSGLLTK